MSHRLSPTLARWGARLAAGVAAALSLASCILDTTDVKPRVAARLDIVAGNGQEGPVGAGLANTLVVKVSDQGGLPLGGQTVDFRVVSGGGSVSAGSAQTDDQGQVQARWTLGTSTAPADSQRVEARAVDATGATLAYTTFRAIARPDVAASVTAVGPASRTGGAGSVVLDSLAVRVADRYTNPIPNAEVTWTASNGGTVSPAASRTDGTGVARARWTLGGIVATQTATATLAGVGPVAFTAQTAPGAVAKVTISPGLVRFTTIGRQTQLSVAAADAYNNPVSAPATLIVRDAAVATLEGGPVVRARGEGSTFLVATVQGVSDSIPVLVQQVVASVRITPGSAPMVLGDTLRYSATAADSSGAPITNARFTWRAVPSTMVTVNAAGLVTATDVGFGAIFARAGQVEASATARIVNRFTAFEVDAGAFHTCAYRDDYTLCWGSNSTRQLGSATPTTGIPQAATGYLTLVRLAAGGPGIESPHPVGQTCALSPDGVYCWGNDNMRQLGGPPGTESCRPGPSYSYPCRTAVEPVQWLGAIRSLGMGALHGCVVAVGGGAYCWGSNRFGELGTATPVTTQCTVEGASGAQAPCSGTPLLVGGHLSLDEISAGSSFTCAVSYLDTFCWGLNTSGQLGTHTADSTSTPVAVTGGSRLTGISSGTAHSCAIRTDGGILCWGAGGSGQLGNRGTSNSAAAVQVVGSHTFRMVTAGGAHTCALTTAGAAYCWGRNTNGALGAGSGVVSSPVPVAVAGGFTFADISAGADHTCGIIMPSREVLCWGSRSQGQVGGTPVNGAYFTPQRVRPIETPGSAPMASRGP